MEHFPLNKKESGVNRVVGFGLEREGEFLEYFKNKFEINSSDPREKQKTSEQLEFIKRINIGMRSFLSRYGVDAIEIPPDNVHIFDKKSLQKMNWKILKKDSGQKADSIQLLNRVWLL